MDVDQGRVRPRQRRPSPRRPSERRPDGKRRRLNSDDDADAQKPAEHLQLVDEDGAENQTPAHTPPAASARQAPVLAVYVHNAERFTCTLFWRAARAAPPLRRGQRQLNTRKRAPAVRLHFRLRLRQWQGHQAPPLPQPTPPSRRPLSRPTRPNQQPRSSQRPPRLRAPLIPKLKLLKCRSSRAMDDGGQRYPELWSLNVSPRALVPFQHHAGNLRCPESWWPPA
ncbi:hypothetical protein PHYSODRAFT_505460 [Phytophthora sojae]|uniref:Uncharacterized protein n=1 Tax=Phytophthora sojae (strain P6497) TaxID=1094619 RepID=G4ZN41_PHYSP|nr:hypothetical protein PHYSODRAFT_505460 [Phytophthora sojae]EGZ15364.1 hypothetical protein PHYSODRAFT_505460 [Phytophthora sojae]|eukprot:XP_009529113.1 hypothetical protein PHYSODRAFT_505460 [Phytophthora sojae]